jgi:hypothetical protein
MILFFGTRTGKRREKQLTGVICPYCAQSGSLRASLTPHYVHLFWIPVFRLKPFMIIACDHCKKGYDREDFTPEMEHGIRDL